MLKGQCSKCKNKLTEDDLVLCCDRCGKPIEEEMMGEAVAFMVDPGDDNPEGEGPQYLMVMSSDIEGETDGNHYCKTCTTYLLDQSFIRDMREANNEEPEPSEDEEVKEDSDDEQAGVGDDDEEEKGE